MSELTDLIDTIEQDPAAVREALELIKRQVSDLPAITDVSDQDSFVIRDASSITDRRATLGSILSSISGTQPNEVPLNSDASGLTWPDEETGQEWQLALIDGDLVIREVV